MQPSFVGTVNIAPTLDIDVFDPAAHFGQTHVTPPERAALASPQSAGLRDVVRERWPTERVFTYWDYRAGMFHKDLGMRIDLVLATAPVAARVRAARVDRHDSQGREAQRPRPVTPIPRGTGWRHRWCRRRRGSLHQRERPGCPRPLRADFRRPPGQRPGPLRCRAGKPVHDALLPSAA